MKNISKGLSPAWFENWKVQPNPDWNPTYSDLQNPEKKNLQTALLQEQGFVCCYCGRAVELTDSHIEHFRPQHGGYPELQLNYENLFVSCLRELKPGSPVHCGHAKANTFEEDSHISPRDETCEQRFIYTQLGEILPTSSTDANAEFMAKLLALDGPFLRSARAAVIGVVLDPTFLSTATTDELRRLRDAFRQADEKGNLQSFGHVIARYAEQWANRSADPPPALAPS